MHVLAFLIAVIAAAVAALVDPVWWWVAGIAFVGGLMLAAIEAIDDRDAARFRRD